MPLIVHASRLPSLRHLELWGTPSPRLPSSIRSEIRALTVVKPPEVIDLTSSASPSPEPKLSPPVHLFDPITHVLMHDPIRLPSGHACDRSTVRRLLEGGTGTDPFTGLAMRWVDVKADTRLREEVGRWMEAREDRDERKDLLQEK